MLHNAYGYGLFTGGHGIVVVVGAGQSGRCRRRDLDGCLFAGIERGLLGVGALGGRAAQPSLSVERQVGSPDTIGGGLWRVPPSGAIARARAGGRAGRG